jgi:hypothetical protein
MATNKVNSYAKLRNAQKKNKSINEERDAPASDMENNYFYEDSPSNRKTNDLLSRCKENKHDDLLKVFGDNVSTGNLDYVNSLIKGNSKKKSKHVNHQRTKSNITESNTKNTFTKISAKDLMDPTPNLSPDISHTTIRREPNPDFVELDNKNISVDENIYKSKNGGRIVITTSQQPLSTVVSNVVMEDDTPTLTGNEERLFDQYFKKNNKNAQFLKRSVSVEDIRNEKEMLTNPNQSTSVFAPMEIDLNHYSSKNEDFHKKNVNENFLGVLDAYINYFAKSENVNSQRNAKLQDFLTHTSTKSAKSFQKELNHSLNENKMLREHCEQLELKLNEVLLSKKKSSHELKEYKTRDEENRKKLKLAEQKINKLRQKKDEYKFKLLHTQELLAKEKIDNENNLFALKKVLSSKINNTLENKVSMYKDKGSVREKDQFMNAIYMLKKDNQEVNKSKFKEKRSHPENMLIESRYADSKNREKNSKQERGYDNSKQDRGYDVPSLLSPKIGTTSEDEEASNNSMQSSDLEASYEQENLKIDNNKNISKEQEIKYLRDRLVELMDHPEPSYNNMMLNDGKNSTRNKSKGKPKTMEFTLKNGDIRDRQGSLSKIANIPKLEARYKYVQNDRAGDLSSTTENLHQSFSLNHSDS